MYTIPALWRTAGHFVMCCLEHANRNPLALGARQLAALRQRLDEIAPFRFVHRQDIDANRSVKRHPPATYVPLLADTGAVSLHAAFGFLADRGLGAVGASTNAALSVFERASAVELAPRGFLAVSGGFGGTFPVLDTAAPAGAARR